MPTHSYTPPLQSNYVFCWSCRNRHAFNSLVRVIALKSWLVTISLVLATHRPMGSTWDDDDKEEEDEDEDTLLSCDTLGIPIKGKMMVRGMTFSREDEKNCLLQDSSASTPPSCLKPCSPTYQHVSHVFQVNIIIFSFSIETV